MKPNSNISVVIPTINRKKSLLNLLQNLNDQTTPLLEVIVVDAGKQFLRADEIQKFHALEIRYLESEASVCFQRNKGVRAANGSWIFLCDDDLEVPKDYISLLLHHVQQHPEAGAISGLVLQKDTGMWIEQFPIKSLFELWRRFIFQLSIWGEITNKSIFAAPLKKYYAKRGNHLSKAGWPVLTNFSGEYFKTPVYGLGASLVKKKWLLKSPYDEVLDPNGIGDNYGVALGFPSEGIHVVKAAHVFHHKIEINRLREPLQYYRRVLALNYFNPHNCGWLLWSLFGNFFGFLALRRWGMVIASLRLFSKILTNKNPYILGKRANKRVVSPMLENDHHS